jgi:hypothetical protein
MYIAQMVLTVDADFDSLADSGRDAVGGDAQVGAHIEATNAGQLEYLTLPFGHCEESSDNEKHEGVVTNCKTELFADGNYVTMRAYEIAFKWHN